MHTFEGALARPLPAVKTQPSEADFDRLFVEHYESVYRVAYRLASTREEAEDLAQEAFLRLHRQPGIWGAGQAGGRAHNVRGWLYRVVTNLAYNALRARTRRRRREDVAWQASAAMNGEVDPAEAAIRADERVTVHRALARLPERQVQLLLMRYAGMSYRELAEALDLAQGSIGTLLARAESAFERAYRGNNEPRG